MSYDVQPLDAEKEHGAEGQDASPREPSHPSLAAIEAGEAHVEDHLHFFAEQLQKYTRDSDNKAEPRLSIPQFRALYERNNHPHGHHFVVHQHNHPIAGTHYDLRLQFSHTSSISFAIPYGLPGNPNSRRPGRMAIETRVHNLWNHLIESASRATGSLLIWDTGEYSVLPRVRKDRKRRRVETTDEDLSDQADGLLPASAKDRGELHENEKLIQAFRSRYIRLRLHGTKLPSNYTITLRLPLANDVAAQPAPPRSKRQRRRRNSTWAPTPASTSGSSDDGNNDASGNGDGEANADATAAADASEAEEGNRQEAEQIRATNAYPGATNTIGSTHQRHWFILLDKPSSGFVKDIESNKWVRPSAVGTDGQAPAGFEPFFVRGPDVEKSVVTGRRSDDVLADEGVKGFQLRKMWRAIVE